MNEPHQPHQSTLNQQAPDSVPDGTQYHKAQEALAKSEEKYRTLFGTIDQGYCLVELIDDERGEVIDYRFLDVNPVFEQQTGFVGATGKRVREIAPQTESHWLKTYETVVRTGQPVRFENYAEHNRRWYTVFATCVGSPGSRQIAIVFDDITERKQSQQHQVFLLKVSDTLRALPNEDAIANCALRELAGQLQLDRCYVGVYQLAEDRGEFTHQVGNDRVPPVPDRVRLSDFPDALRVAFDRTLVIDDVGRTAGLTDMDRQNLSALGFSALVASTLRQGESNPLWSIVAISSRPRHWTPAEIELIDEVTERTWTAIERVKAEEALRHSESRTSFLLWLTDTLRPLSNPVEIQYQAARVLGEFLGANRIGYASTQENKKLVAVTLHYKQGVPGIEGVYHYVDYGAQLLSDMQSGKTVVRPDTALDPTLSEAEKDAHERLQLGATVNVPLLKQGRLVAILFVHFQQAHAWSAHEVSLIEETAERIWTALERARAEEALRESETRFRTLVQNLPDYAIFRIDPAGMITEWTEGAQHVKGYTAEEVTGQHISLFYTPEGLAQGELAHEVEQATQSGRAEREGVRIRKGGERFWVDEIMTAIRDGAGRLVGFTKISRDITGPKQAQEALRDSQQRLQIVLNSIADHAIITLDPLSRITSWNAGAEQLFGFSEGEAIGQSVDLIFTPEDRVTGEMEKELETARGQGWAPDERYHLRKDGSRLYLSGVLSSLHGADGQLLGYVKVARDLTDRRSMEQALREAGQRKDEFLAMLAHELRNPMSTIRSGLQILSLTAGDQQTTHATVAMINRQTDHLVRLVDDLLDVSRISQGKIELRKERVNVVDLVSQAAQASDSLYQPQGRRLTVDLPASPIYIEGDATRLAQVVTNLLTNGLRYTRPGGQVWLSLEHRDDEAILNVRDNGIGLAKDQLSAIFELFVQVDNSLARAQGGLGLGLTLVKRLVELHGGRVAAQSEGLDKGSLFTVHLPTLSKAAEPRPNIREEPTNRPAKPRLLLVDDNPDAAMTLSMLLRLKGYEVHTRNSGQAGLEAVERLQPTAILLDIGMPDLDGYETCRLIRQQSRGEPIIVIALTGYGQEDDRQRTQAAGFDGHLVKPVDIAVLLKLITELLNQEKTSSELDQATI